MKAARFVVRCCALMAAVVLALPILPWAWAPMILPAASPYTMICSVVAARSASVVTLIGLPVLVLALFRRRWFCRYVCPAGLLAELVGRIRRSSDVEGKTLPPIAQWVALLTLGGAILGYPLLLWMDPLSIFDGFFGLFRRPVSMAGVIASLGLPIVLSIGLIRRNLWCGQICPLGATQDLLNMPKRLIRRAGPPEDESPAEGKPLARRSVLAMGLGAVWAGATLKIPRAGRSQALRPPGAADEGVFTGLCVRCGNCIRACPERIIHADLGRSGIRGFLTPVIRFEESYCREDCRLCTQVCPSGAIARLSIEEKRKAVIGLARVDMSQCLLSGEGECTACGNQCPYGAIKIVFDKEKYSLTPLIDAQKCNGCGACQVACPTDPKAITVVPH